MTDEQLANEFWAIRRALEQIQTSERDASIGFDRRFERERSAIEEVLQLVQAAKGSGEWRNTRPNVFDILGQSHREDAHSSFLAWALNPAQSHGFGDAFLREFMRRSVKQEPPSRVDLRVSREYRGRVDLRFDIHVKGDRWRLIVENKVDDFPWAEQCRKYQGYCRRLQDLGEQVWLVYVTSAIPPSLPNPWISYREIRQILESLTPDASARTVIENFCEHVISDLEV